MLLAEEDEGTGEQQQECGKGTQVNQKVSVVM